MIVQVLSAEVERPKPPHAMLDEEKVRRCADYVLSLIDVPNLTYEKREIVARAIGEGFKIQEVEEALKRLTQMNSLRYSELTEGYSLA
jgi:hypothetical protein